MGFWSTIGSDLNANSDRSEKVSGKVEEIYVSTNQYIKKDTPLFKIKLEHTNHSIIVKSPINGIIIEIIAQIGKKCSSKFLAFCKIAPFDDNNIYLNPEVLKYESQQLSIGNIKKLSYDYDGKAFFNIKWNTENQGSIPKNCEILKINFLEIGILRVELTFNMSNQLYCDYRLSKVADELKLFNETSEDIILINQILNNDNYYVKLNDKSSIDLMLYVLKSEKFNIVSYYTVIKTTLGLPFNQIDSARLQLPLITDEILQSPNKGIWEFWGIEEYLSNHNIKSRNPLLDLKSNNVAIDFGTSSTVVAYEDDRGIGQLIPVGLSDFTKKLSVSDYENPTILEFIDFKNFLASWQLDAYRPGVLWRDVKASHEALERFRDNDTDTNILASIFVKLKHWALKQDTDTKNIIRDFKAGYEHEVKQLVENNPVKGVPIVVNEKYEFDPIELYAWMLGMMINWRGRGIYVNYYMTFPVDYPRNIKDKILASFRRGIQRSFPEPFVKMSEFSLFNIEERVTEPLAFAAIALDTLKLEPTDTGRPYAVFDFGGGTTDFDFGLYRLPNDDETDDGYDEVFESFGSAGDRFLGGENILEHMAYHIFNHPDNISFLRENNLSFTRPIDIPVTPGSEFIISDNRSAQTNSIMLISKLRNFWEKEERISSAGSINITLLSNKGEKIETQLIISESELYEVIEDKIYEGLKNFFSAMKIAFSTKDNITQIDILLSGNACQSSILQNFLGLNKETHGPERFDILNDYIDVLWDGKQPKFIIHAPLNKGINASESNLVNAKTGVALGLLKLCPGSTTKIINHSFTENNESTFLYSVGRIVRNQFEVKLTKGTQSGWTELGKVIEERFRLAYSKSPRALVEKLVLGESDLTIKMLNFPSSSNGQSVYTRPKGLDKLEITTASNNHDITDAIQNYLIEIDLTK